jgi:hypothetical protein
MRTALLLTLTSIQLAACSPIEPPLPEGQCINRVRREFVSPDRQYKAVLFGRRCGEALPTSNISILLATEPLPDAAGNAFVNVPPAHGKGHSERIEMAWSAPHKFRITRNSEMQVRVNATQVADVAIEHSTRFHNGG